MLKKLLGHSVIYAIAPRLPALVGIFTLPILTKYLTPLDYGIYGVIMAYQGLLIGFRDLGLGVIYSNTYFKHPKLYKLIWRNLHAFNYSWGLVYAFFFIILLYFIIPDESHNNLGLIIPLIVIPNLIFDPLKMMGNLYYQYEQKPIPISIISVFTGLCAIALNIYTIAYLELGYIGWFISTFISGLITYIIYFYLVYIKIGLTPIFRINTSTYKRYLKISLPIIPHKYAGYLLNSSDRVVMTFLGINTHDIGLYNFAYRFGNYSQQIMQGLATGSRPFYMKIISSNNKKNKYFDYRNLSFLLFSLAIVAISILCLWMKEIFQILVNNKELSNMYPLAIIIVMSYVFNPIYQSVGIVLSYNEETNSLWKISFIAGLINVFLNLIFIPLYGYEIAAYTTFISLLYMSYSGTFLKAYRKNQSEKSYSLAWVILVIILFTLVFYFRNHEILFKLILSSLILFFFFFIYLKFRKSHFLFFNYE
jgi:O-antigen/teichoic acid export membrane protein